MKVGIQLAGVVLFISQIISQRVYADPSRGLARHENYDTISVRELISDYQGLFPADTVCKLYSGQNSEIYHKAINLIVGYQYLPDGDDIHILCKSKREGIVVDIPVIAKLGTQIGLTVDLMSVGDLKIKFNDVGGKSYHSLFGQYHGVSMGLALGYNCLNISKAINSSNVSMSMHSTGFTGIHLNLISYFHLNVSARDVPNEQLAEIPSPALITPIENPPAAADDLEMKRVPAQQQSVGVQAVQEDVGESCPICYEKMEKNRKKLNCTHSFCKKCITKWLKRNSTCPMCREPVKN